MGVAIPGVTGLLHQPTGQVIDGSLKFDSSQSHYLSRTPSSAGNRKTWTWSGWFNRTKLGTVQGLFSAITTPGSNTDRFTAFINTNDKLYIIEDASGTNYWAVPTQVFRDVAWYHLVFAFDTTISTPTSDRVKVYVNGDEVTSFTLKETITENRDTFVNSTLTHYIGLENSLDYPSKYWDGHLSQLYLIDGQALGPEYFGYTDPLTNTWRPKKYTGTFGTNGFWLPMDGNSPIGQDKSGRGNNWTPVNFGGSVALDNPQVSGARPILDTTQGGTQAAPGVFGSKENKYYTVTTANGSVYQFDITSGDNPSLSFIRGATYKFDYSSFTGHPVLFSSTNPDSSTTAYTDGTSIASNVISFTVPHNAPDTLYYYCQNHPTSMNGSISITTDETKADPYAWKNVLALPLVGANSDVSSQINSGSTTKVMTSVGNAAASSDTSNFYGGSFEFDGTGDGITCPDNTDFEFGSGDFTVECWVKQDDTSGFDVYVGKYGGSSNGEFIVGKNGNTPTFYWQDTGGNANINATNFTGNTSSWYHMACVRDGDVFTMYINGICENSTTDATTLKSTTNKLTIGIENDESSSPFDGYLQDVRIYKGVAKYSGTTIGTQYFIPASTNPDILPDTPSGVSGGSKLAKITDGAVAFDGTGDYLSLAASSDFNFGTGNFTMEGFFYKNSTTTLQTLLCSENYYTVGNNGNWILRITSGTQIAFATYDGQSNEEYSEFTAPNGIGGWHHFALVREGTGTNQTKFYYDGKLAGSMTVSKSLTDAGTNGLRIGEESASGPGNNFMDGFLSNIRIIKGTALYTADFTPPTAPLTNITNTSLLCCQSPTSATEAAVTPGTITANGDAAATTFNPFNTDINTVRGQETGYCTLNPLDALSQTLSDGNLTSYGDGTTSTCAVTGTISVSSGKYYYEMTAGSGVDIAGIWTVPRITDFPGSSSDSYGYFGDGQSLNNGSGYTYASAFTIGDTIGVALDLDNGTLRFYKNGIDQGIAFSNISGEYRPAIRAGRSGTTSSVSVNFGQKPFKFSPPEGFLPLNAANVRPETVIARPDQYVGIVTYTSNNSTLSVTDFKFRPDLLIFKNRDTANHWGWFDSVRGPNKWLRSSGTNNEVNTSGGGYGTGTMNSFDPFGFTLGDDVGANVTNYPSDDGHVVYGFRAGGNPGISSTTYWIDDKEYSASGAKMSVGSLNSLAYNQSAEWSDDVAGTPYPGQTVSRLFDGSVLTGLIPNNGTSLVFTTTAFPSITKLRIYGYSYTGNANGIRVNGNDYTSLFDTGGGYSSSSKWVTIPESHLERIEWSIESSGLENGHLGAIEVDGKILVDTSVSINAPTIQPTGCSVGTKQGFSIVQFAGTSGAATIPHGLTQAPQFAIIRSNYSSANWPCYHTGLSGPTKYVWLNSQNGEATQAASWNSQDPTQFLFHIAGEAEVNRNGYHSIAYMWHDVPGLQKFGQYTGNATGNPFIELGFRPALLWIKNTSTGSTDWVVIDSERQPFNQSDMTKLYINSANSESTIGVNNQMNLDFLSNGFKLRDSNNKVNASGDTYIYAAWAEAPTFNLYGGQANAR